MSRVLVLFTTCEEEPELVDHLKYEHREEAWLQSVTTRERTRHVFHWMAHEEHRFATNAWHKHRWNGVFAQPEDPSK